MILVGFSHTHEGIYPILVLYESYSFMNIRHNGWWRKTKMWQSLVYVNHWLVISKLTSYFRWQIRKIFMCNWRLFLSSVVKACILENPVADRIIRNVQCRRQNYQLNCQFALGTLSKLPITQHKPMSFLLFRYILWNVLFILLLKFCFPQDLVAWVTLGFHHLPHTEDLPVTTTSGKHQSFYLFPYNYFEECPSMQSRDAIYVSHKDPKNPEKGIHFEYYGTGDVNKYNNKGVCKYQPLDTAEFWMSNPDDLIEVTKHNGVI